jgi:tetratricopeptide (TPR) repeat protein
MCFVLCRLGFLNLAVLIFLPYLNLAVLGLIFPSASAKYHDYNRLDRLEKTTEAIEAYSKAIELDKDYVAAVYNRGNAFLKLGKEDLAYKDLSTAIELDANFYQA